MKLAAALTLLALAAYAEPVHIVYGDTIKVDGVTYRLWGIDAPELRQSRPGGFPAGAVAARQLSNMMRGHTITCERKDADRYGRTVALCRAEGADLGAAIVRAGWGAGVRPLQSRLRGARP